MTIIFILAFISIFNLSAFGKEEVEIGMVFESGCPMAKQVLVDKIIPEIKLFAKDGKKLFF